jgi:hypothetical protein
MSKEGYECYLKSNWWKERRRLALLRCDRRCSVCGARKSLQVHHLNYLHLGDEQDEDLEVLCRDCHREKHDLPRIKKKSSQQLLARRVRRVLRNRHHMSLEQSIRLVRDIGPIHDVEQTVQDIMRRQKSKPKHHRRQPNRPPSKHQLAIQAVMKKYSVNYRAAKHLYAGQERIRKQL